MNINKIGTCCIITDNQKFTSTKATSIGKLMQGSFAKLCGVEKHADLTPEIYQTNRLKLQGKLFDKVKSNLNNLHNCFLYISKQSETEKFFRVGSDLLPFFDHPLFNDLYDDVILDYVDRMLARTKKLIDEHQIRVTTHPGHFTLIDSLNPNVRRSAIECLKYHKYFMERLTTPADGGCINIHLHGVLDDLPEIDQLREAGLIEWLTFENSDKGKADHEYTLSFCERFGIRYVFDIHHNRVLTGDLLPYDDYQRILNTWPKGQLPKLHLSQGAGGSQDRKHSDYITDQSLVQYLRELPFAVDVALECKSKNLGVKKLIGDLTHD